MHIKTKSLLKYIMYICVNVQPSGDAAVAGDQAAGQRLVIWGTDVNVGTCKEKFQVCWGSMRLISTCQTDLILRICVFLLQRFLQQFTDPDSREEENAGLDLNEPLYMQKLDEVRRAALITLKTGLHYIASCKILHIHFMRDVMLVICLL